MSTRAWSLGGKCGKPSGYCSLLSGLGLHPNFRLISRARELVPHGGPRCTANTRGCCKMRHKSSWPCCVARLMRMTGALTCLITCASTPVPCWHPTLLTAAVNPAVPENTSMKTRLAKSRPRTRLENFVAKSDVVSKLRLTSWSGMGFTAGSSAARGKGSCGGPCAAVSCQATVALHWNAECEPKHFIQLCIPLGHDCPVVARSQPFCMLKL